ncbi:hypothetical protein KKE28_04945 [Patescibacteria group bacterium]|nr:hypothetical protein [Patescibacteria group bacterium]
MNHVSETIAEFIGPIGSVMANTELPKPTVSPDEWRRAEQAVKNLTEWNDLQLEFRCRETEPLENGETLTLDTYVDTKGHEYRIESSTGTIVQMGPESGRYSTSHEIGSESNPAVSELRAKAVEIIQRQIHSFDSILSSLHPLEANDRRRVYFFRWENLSEPLSESKLPPFVQVGLYANGALASFADTLSEYRNNLSAVDSHITDLPASWTKMKRPVGA